MEQKIEDIHKQYEFVVGTYIKNGGLSRDQHSLILSEMDSIRDYKIKCLKNDYKITIRPWKKEMALGDPFTIYKRLVSSEVLYAFKHEVGESIQGLFRSNSMKNNHIF